MLNTKQISELELVANTNRAIRKANKKRRETKVYYSDKENISKTMKFLFGDLPANKNIKKVKDSNSQAKRVVLGLTNRKVDVDYNLQENGTKICVCCNEIYYSKDYSKKSSTKDGLRSVCRVCDNRRRKLN